MSTGHTFLEQSTSDDFAQISQEILYNCKLHVGEHVYQFTEIEFYLHNDDHKDIYTHRKPEQLENNSFYFHHKGGTYKGVDITFGDNKSYGGILIRSIVSSDGKVITGPSKVVDELYSKIGIKSFTEVGKWRENITTKDTMWVSHDAEEKKENEVVVSTRVGINNIVSDIKKMYTMKLYRYAHCNYYSKVKHGWLFKVVKLFTEFNKNVVINAKMTTKYQKLAKETTYDKVTRCKRVGEYIRHFALYYNKN